MYESMKGYIEGAISMSAEALHTTPSKQQINTKSSTESEVVRASDYILWMVWAKGFLEEHGCKLKKSIFYYDDTSTVRLESNGRKAYGEKSRHINIIIFFIKGIIQRENIELHHCLTERIIVDFLKTNTMLTV